MSARKKKWSSPHVLGGSPHTAKKLSTQYSLPGMQVFLRVRPMPEVPEVSSVKPVVPKKASWDDSFAVSTPRIKDKRGIKSNEIAASQNCIDVLDEQTVRFHAPANSKASLSGSQYTVLSLCLSHPLSVCMWYCGGGMSFICFFIVKSTQYACKYVSHLRDSPRSTS